MAIMLRTKYMRRDARRHPWWSKLVVFIYFERSLITGCNFYWHSSSISKLLKEQKLINSSPRRLIAWHLHKQHRWYLVTTGQQSRARLPMSRCCDGSRSSSESVSVSWYKLSVTPTISWTTLLLPLVRPQHHDLSYPYHRHPPWNQCSKFYLGTWSLRR